MKLHGRLVALAAGLAATSLMAQNPVSVNQKVPDVAVHKEVLPSPESIRPKPAARPSTAEAGPAHAGWKPLSELPSVPLMDRNGQTKTLPGTISGARHWFLLYRTGNCVPCDRLMLALQGSSSGELKAGKPYVIVVDSPDAAALERVRASFAGLSDATWALDKQKAVATALRLHGSPVLIAMDGKRVAWRVAGSLDTTDTVLHMTNAWLAENASEKDQAPAVSWIEASKAAAAAQSAAVTHPSTGAPSAPKQ